MEMNNKKKQYNNYNGLKNNFNLNEIILMDFFSYFTCNLKHQYQIIHVIICCCPGSCLF